MLNSTKMPKKKKEKEINLEKYAECAPRCYGCKHYQRLMGEHGNTYVPHCNAPFNGGNMIFHETIDICDDEGAYAKK